MAFVGFMAWKYVRGSRGFASVVAWFSLIGIALGVATLIIVMSVMNGFRHELWGVLVGVRGHLCVDKQPVFRIQEAEDAMQQLGKDPRVEGSLPVLERQAVLMMSSQARGVQIHGIRSDDMRLRPHMQLKEGKPLSEGVWVGNQLAYLLNIHVGDTLTLMQPMGRVTPFGRIPEQMHTVVQGIFSTGMYEFDKNIVLISLPQAQSFFHAPEHVSQVEVHLKPGVDPAAVARDWPASSPYRMMDWKHADSAIFHAVEVERHVMFVILTLIILIASFNIVSSLVMLVQQKTRGIAILRTMGVHQGTIGCIFLMAGSSIGVVGTSLGVAMGLGFATHVEGIRRWLESLTGASLFQAEIYFLSRLPCQVNYGEVAGIVVLALVVTVLAAMYPAWQATRMEPVDALRY